MTFDDFKEITDLCFEFENYINQAQELHLDFIESPLYNNYYKLLHKYVLEKEFNNTQIDVIYQYMFENEFGARPIKVYIDDEEKSISTVEELYNFIMSLKNDI